MQLLYNSLINISRPIISIAGKFSPKLKDFSEGRKDLFPRLEQLIEPGSTYIWIHAASLGEFEMAVPVLKMLKNEHPSKKIIVSFFSPSGFKNKKRHDLVDIFTYLPLDTNENAQKFIELIKPEMAFFIKYDFWPNLLLQLKVKKVPTYLVSGVFRENQSFFNFYGKWMIKSLKAFHHFFVQNEESAELLQKIGFKNITVAGDTRFDRVAAQLTQDNHIDFIERFKANGVLTVFGSSWPEDEQLFIDYINKHPEQKFLIAPHEIKAEKIQNLCDQIEQPVMKFTELDERTPEVCNVFILDTIGYLGRAYSYADIAYVGGAAGNTGLHNILEPATFGTPVIIGSNYTKFPEAARLRQLAGLFSVKNSEEFEEIMDKFISNPNFRKKSGMIAGHFINSNTGATRILESYLKNLES
ncbi:3-deoxy-D-manno-octulosonic acid transferase [Christiangramia portivictoriae]|uniref:3-deoxy-D-manno-octulosonic acid transferase n=1 Tax=Christiangramia portivictoriae TaxID=326069 RepID=UPI00040F0237|nr:glycosyltransferase N-terminal domain-containing protein [Christiangramia portivictoriae]